MESTINFKNNELPELKNKIKIREKRKLKKKETCKDSPIIIIPIKEFNVFGCPLSTDIDVVCSVDKRETIELIRQGKVIMDTNTLINELEALGYNLKSRVLDANPAYFEDKNLIMVLKGSKETQNMILSTYNYHKQKYPCLVEKMIEIDIIDKLRSVAKFILDNMEVLIGKNEYIKERPNKKQFYGGGWVRIEYSIKMCKKINFIDSEDFKDAMKSLTMKIIQLVLLNKEEEEYTKVGLAEKFTSLYPKFKDNVIWLLTRGKQGNKENIQECIIYLINEYEKLALDNREDYNWLSFNIDISKNPTSLPSDLIEEFFLSPLEPTIKFVDGYNKLCDGNFRIGEFFPLKCLNTNLIPEKIMKNCIIVDQRSKEWLEFLKYYKCGKNTGLVECKQGNYVETYYNLIRGSIMESMIIETVDFSEVLKVPVKKIVIGLLVEDKSKESKGIAPDLLLLMEDNSLMPVEIKCLHSSFKDDHDFRRGMKLAKNQLRSAIDIIGGNKGLIVLMNINKEKGKFIYEGRMTYIDFK